MIIDALGDLPVRTLVTVDPRADQATLGTQPAHVRVERYGRSAAPELSVFKRSLPTDGHHQDGTASRPLPAEVSWETGHGLPPDVEACRCSGCDRCRSEADCR